MNTEPSDMALLLAGPESMAAVAAGSQSPNLGLLPDAAKQVEQVVPINMNPDVEAILAYQPDLVLAVARTGGEKDSSEQLKATGVEMIIFDSDAFATPEAWVESLATVGKATGQEEKAAAIGDELLGEIAEIDATKGDKTPSMITLMARGGKIMAMDSGNMMPGLALRAGATDAAAKVGITATRPIDAEMLVAINPDLILLEDYQGAGEAPFAEFLANPALAAIPAVANGNVHLIENTDAGTVAGTRLADGFNKIMEIVQS